MKTFKDYLAEEEYDRQRDADAVSGKPRKTSIGGGKKPKGYSKDKAEKAAMDNVKKALAKNEETDYEAKKKALQDIQMDPNTSKDPELKKELSRRKAELEKTKEASETNEGGLGVVEKLLQGITKDFVNGNDSAAQEMVDMLKKYNAPMDKVADMLEQYAEKLTKKTFGIFDNPLKKTPAGNAADRMTILADYIRKNANKSEELERIKELSGIQAESYEETYDGDDFYEAYGDLWFNEDEGDGQLPKSPKVLKLVINDLKKFKAEQEEAKKQGYDEDVRMMQGRIDDMMDIAKLVKDGGPIAALDTSVQDVIVDYYEKAGEPLSYAKESMVDEAEYQGRKVKLGKPMRGDVKKFKVYVKNPKGNVVKVNFGDPDMKIKKSNPARRRSFRARHNCDNPGPRHKARYWSCRKW